MRVISVCVWYMYSHIEKLSDSQNLCQVVLNVHAMLSIRIEERLPLHTALQWDSTGCKTMEPSNVHRITFICKPLSVDPLSISHWEGLEKVQQSLWLLSTEGLWITTLPTPNVFLGQRRVSLSSCPWANTFAFGTRRQRRENTDTYFKVSSGFKGQEAEEDDFCSFLCSLSIKCGERACCGGGGRQNCRYTIPGISVRYNSSCLWGSSAISTLSLGFSRGYNLPLDWLTR